ncbi:hypothetical protein [Abyssisolibacter fermentans]|uniref:hypothetical protein n=1 Tax=Abyssisolibacter fermentans TaxID=1766203 RepID=UPI0008350BDB|nr:hypothetical protein [Abyssisolibacter fermentans]
MKKSFIFLIVIILFLFIFKSVVFFFNEKQSKFDKEINLKADTFMNFNSEMLKQSKANNMKNITCSIVDLKEIVFLNTQGKLIGSLNYNNGEVVDFELVGKLKNRGKDKDILVIADLKDSLDNFEVINCSLSISPGKMNLFNKEEYLRNKHQIHSVISLIFKEKETNRLTYIEWFNPNINVEDIVKKQNILPKAEREEILWHKKLLDFHTGISISSVVTYKDCLIDGTYKSRPVETVVFSNQYNYMGETYEQELKIKEEIYLKDVHGDADMSAWIKVCSNRTICLTNPLYSSDESFLSVGRGGPTKLKLIIQGNDDEVGGDAFYNMKWDVKGVTSTDIQTGLDANILHSRVKSYVPINSNISEKFLRELNFNRKWCSFTNDIENDELTRYVEVEFNKEYMTNSAKDNHKFIVDFHVRKYDEIDHDDGMLIFKYSYFVWDQIGHNHMRRSNTLIGNYSSYQ